MSMTKPTSEQVTFLASGSGAVQRTALDKFRETVSVKDFGAVGDGVADDTAAIQAALDYCVANKTSLYIPHGTYSITTLTINFGGSSLAMPKQIGFRIFGDGGGKERFTGSSGTDGTVLVYAGSSGSAITFAGRLSASMRLEGFTVLGTALAVDTTGSTAIGINLVGAINHSIRDVVVTGFDIGLYAELSYIGLHSNCRFTQNNVNCKFGSACNSIVAEQVDYTAGLLENLAIETNTVNGTRNLTFVGCLFESAKVGIRINAETATIQNVAFITPYFENSLAPASPELVVAGYDSAGAASSAAFRVVGLRVSDPSYNGVTPGVMFKLNNCENVEVGNLNIQNAANAFATTSTVRRVSVDGHSTFGGSMAIPLATGAFKNSLQRRANYNLVAGGNYLVAGGSYIMSAGVTSTLSYVNGEPIVEFTVATSTTGTVRFHVENIGNLSGSFVQILVAAQRGDSTVDLSADIYDSTNTAWSGTLMTGWSTTEIQTIGRTQIVPSSNTARNYIELKVVNSSPTLTKTFNLKGVYLLMRDSGPVVTDAIDVLSAMSGTADCDPSATVDVAFTNADDYRVIATPDTSGVTCYVTKSATSFDITCSANALVDYVVIPRIRVLQ
jgi:hypothetical protein